MPAQRPTQPSAPESEISPEFLATFLKLRSRHVGERIEGEMEIQALGPVAVDYLLAIIKRQDKVRRTRRNIYLTLLGLVCLFGLPATAFCVYMMLTSTQPGAAGAYGGALGGILGGGGGGILGGFSWLLAPTADHIAANAALARLEDKRAAGSLLAIVQAPMQDAGTRTSAGMALLRISHKFTEDDEALVDAAEREYLNQAIRSANPSREPDFLTGLILLAAKVGNERTLEAVKTVIVKSTRDERAKSVFEAAHQAALEIQQRIERNKLSGTLLRSSASSANPADGLLRPATTSVPSESSELLRASTSNTASS